MEIIEFEQLLIEAFQKDATPQQAALHAHCSYNDVMNWLATGDNLKRVEALRETPKWEAKKNVSRAITEERDPDYSLKYLTLRDKAFMPTIKHADSDGGPLQVKVINFHQLAPEEQQQILQPPPPNGTNTTP